MGQDLSSVKGFYPNLSAFTLLDRDSCSAQKMIANFSRHKEPAKEIAWSNEISCNINLAHVDCSVISVEVLLDDAIIFRIE